MKIVKQILLSATLPLLATAFSASSPSLQSLLSTHQSEIASLKQLATSLTTDDSILPQNDVFYLRYLLDDTYASPQEREDALKSNVQWRMNEGSSIVTAAHQAISLATSNPDKKWDNTPVAEAAPGASTINTYITPSQCITTTLSPQTNDLVYCIRAGKIDDVSLMSQVSVDQMVDFFLYCKEVNAMVADMRSLQSDSVVQVITCNDLSGVKLIGGSKEFRSSLSLASKKANELYPALNGRTLLLNLPKLLGALVKLFTPLFPEKVRERLRFVSDGPLGKDSVGDLTEVLEGGKGREEFVRGVADLAYGN
ncbi:hypothetical protein ACHAXS_001165 [Conticribra weissflogii]